MSIVPHSMVLNRWIKSLSLTCDDYELRFDYEQNNIWRDM